MSNSFAPLAPKPVNPAAHSIQHLLPKRSSGEPPARAAAVFEMAGCWTRQERRARAAGESVAEESRRIVRWVRVRSAVGSMPGAGTPLPGDVRGRIEGVLGADVSAVSVTARMRAKVALTGALQCRALPTGTRSVRISRQIIQRCALLAHDPRMWFRQEGSEGPSVFPTIQR